MRELNRKVLVIAVFLMAVAMLATPIIGTVMAGKGQEKLSFQIVVGGDISPVGLTIDLIPKKYVFPDDMAEARILTTSYTFADPTVTLLIDGEPYVPDAFDYVGFNMMVLNPDPNPPNPNPRAFVVNKYTTWTFTFDGIGTIVVEENGKMFNLMTPEASVWLRGIGWGTDQLKGVKIEINRGGYDRAGTVMGWPTELFP